MSREQYPANNQLTPEQTPASTPEQAVVAAAEAQKAGNATPEQQALISGVEFGVQLVTSQQRTETVAGENSENSQISENPESKADSKSETRIHTSIHDGGTPNQPHGKNGLREMDERAAADIARSMIDEKVEARRDRDEVPLLNDKAELEIYGSREGRQYIDPETGEPLDTVKNPIIGRVDQIRQDRSYGQTEQERADTAQEYLDSVDDLTSQGFELCQAKLIMDLRDADRQKYGEMVGKLIGNGTSVEDAADKADRLYDKKDEQRLKLIEGEGVYTKEDYDKVTKGEALVDGEDSGKSKAEAEAGDDDKAEKKEQEEELPPRYKPSPELVAALEVSERDWASKRARRDRVSIAIKAASKAEVGEAGVQWQGDLDAVIGDYRNQMLESQKDLLDSYAKQLHEEGKTDDEINDLLEQAKTFDNAEIEQKVAGMEATAQNALVNEVAAESNRIYEQMHPKARKFLNWWKKLGGGKFFSKHRLKGNLVKGALLVVPGFAIGAVAAPLVGALGVAAGGAVLAGAIASGVGRGLLGNKLNQASEDPSIAEERAKATKQEVVAASAEGSDDDRTFEEIINDRGEKNVWRNRRRTGTAVALGAAGAVAGRWVSQSVAEWLNPPATPSVAVVSKPPIVSVRSTPNAPGSNSNIYIQPGNGFTNEFQEYFRAQGWGRLSGARSWELTQQVFGKFGPKHLIDIKSIPGTSADVYPRGGGDWGLGAPGGATLSPRLLAWLETHHQNYA